MAQMCFNKLDRSQRVIAASAVNYSKNCVLPFTSFYLSSHCLSSGSETKQEPEVCRNPR